VTSPEPTFRFRAESRITYAQALLSLVHRARNGTEDFTFGPLELPVLEDQGLAVSGIGVPGWADDFLAEVPGLYLADE
jgi:hypothetical protein